MNSSACPECGHSLLGHDTPRRNTAPLLTCGAITLLAALATTTIAASLFPGGGLAGFLFTLAFTALPFALIFLLTWFATRRRHALTAALLSLPPSILTTIAITNSYHNTLAAPPDAQASLITLFAPLWAILPAAATWLATAMVLYGATILLHAIRNARSSPPRRGESP